MHQERLSAQGQPGRESEDGICRFKQKSLGNARFDRSNTRPFGCRDTKSPGHSCRRHAHPSELARSVVSPGPSARQFPFAWPQQPPGGPERKDRPARELSNGCVAPSESSLLASWPEKHRSRLLRRRHSACRRAPFRKNSSGLHGQGRRPLKDEPARAPGLSGQSARVA